MKNGVGPPLFFASTISNEVAPAFAIFEGWILVKMAAEDF
jgi:hypothetical protein